MNAPKIPRKMHVKAESKQTNRGGGDKRTQHIPTQHQFYTPPVKMFRQIADSLGPGQAN